MKALVLSSGGIDSTTCVAIAVDKFGKENVATVSVFYGQKHDKEIECAKDIAKHYDVKHYELDLSKVFKYSSCTLLNGRDEIKIGSYAEQKEEKEIVETYVPFRNGLMLSAVASLAMSLNPEDETCIYLGSHADDVAGSAYADCTPEFAKAMREAIYLGTYERVIVQTPLVDMTKAEVVKEGLGLNAPYELTWSCYNGGEKQCGKCATCLDRKKAFDMNGATDPVSYMD